MTNENEELFKKVDEVSPEESSEEDLDEQPELGTDDKIVPVLNQKSKQEIKEEFGEKKEANGRILTIKSWEILQPKTTKLVDGVIVKEPPKKGLNSDAQYYPSKLKIMFEEDNLVEYYPGINYFLDKKTGGIKPNVTLNRTGNNCISKLVKLVLLELAKENGTPFKTTDSKNGPIILDLAGFNKFSESVSDVAVLNYLIGKKVKIETTTGIYLGKNWFRNDIGNFVKE